MSKNEPLRHFPQQNRSHQRFNKILDAAAQIFDEVGYENASTELIADKAKTSIGSLYRFFPNKSAIAYSLSERYSEQMQELFATYFNSSTVHQDINKVISDTVQAFDDFYTSKPGCRAIMLQSLVSKDIQDVNKRADYKIVEQLNAFLALRNPEINPVQCKLAALVTIEIANALQIWSLKQDDKFRKQIVSETKTVLIRYLEPLF